MRIPPPPLHYAYYWFILDPKSKQDKVKVTHFKNLPKLQMCKYERDLASIVEDTDRKWFCPHTDGRTDGHTDKVKPVYPIQLRWAGGIMTSSLVSWRMHRLKHMTHSWILSESMNQPSTTSRWRMRLYICKIHRVPKLNVAEPSMTNYNT